MILYNYAYKREKSKHERKVKCFGISMQKLRYRRKRKHIKILECGDYHKYFNQLKINILKTIDKLYFMVYNCFTETMKWRKIMKEINNEQQLLIIAKEEIYKLFRSIPSVKNVTIKDGYIDQNISTDIVIEVSTEYRDVELFVDIKPRGEKRFIIEYINRVKSFIDSSRCMLIAPYISPDSAELLKENGINYMDLSGNCYLVADMIYISVEGKSNQYIPKRSNKNIFARSSLKSAIVLKTLLNEPYREWQVQELVEITGTSLGMISNIKTYLIENNWAEKVNGRFRLKNIQDMLWEWARVCNLKADQTEEYYSLDRIADFEAELSLWNNNHGATVTLGSFSAAARYAPTVRYNKTFVYIEMQDKQEFIRDFGLKKVESGGNVTMCTIYDQTTTMFAREINNSIVTSPVQTILDLLSHAGRGEEAAEAIIQKEFKRL